MNKDGKTQCERCKKFYDSYDGFNYYNGYEIIHYYGGQSDRMHICNDCMKKFEQFMENTEED